MINERARELHGALDRDGHSKGSSRATVHHRSMAPLQTARRRPSEQIAYVLRREHLRCTLTIALVVGLLLTAINQGAVISGGEATAATWVRCALNFLVPFCVSNLGLLSARR